jgi:DNA-binding MarR family transcriptional regulator
MGVITSSLERGSHLIGGYLDSTVGELGLTQGEAHVLSQIGGRSSVSISVLHHEFGHKRSTLTNILDRLETRGLVRREMNRTDRRSILVRLTPSGKRTAGRVNDALDRLEQALSDQVQHRDLAGLAAVVRALEAIAQPTRGKNRAMAVEHVEGEARP